MDKVSHQPDISRRGFLEKVAKGLIVGTAATLGVREALVAQKEVVVETEFADFLPVYEGDHFKPEELDTTSHFDALFIEAGDAIVEQIPLDRISGLVTPKVVSRVSQEEAPILIADVRCQVGDIMKATDFNLVVGGLLLTLGMLIKDKVSPVDTDSVSDSNEKAEQSRRSFLKRISLVISGVLLGQVASSAENLVAQRALSKNSDPLSSAVKRISERVHGLFSHANPQLGYVFLRNAIMAHKMLNYAEIYYRTTGEKARICFRLGAAHAGIEDLLLLGKENIEKLISVYPKAVLDSVIADNGGVQDFCSSRVIQFSQKLDFQQAVVAFIKPNELGVSDNKFFDAGLLAHFNS